MRGAVTAAASGAISAACRGTHLSRHQLEPRRSTPSVGGAFFFLRAGGFLLLAR